MRHIFIYKLEMGFITTAEGVYTMNLTETGFNLLELYSDEERQKVY